MNGDEYGSTWPISAIFLLEYRTGLVLYSSKMNQGAAEKIEYPLGQYIGIYLHSDRQNRDRQRRGRESTHPGRRRVDRTSTDRPPARTHATVEPARRAGKARKHIRARCTHEVSRWAGGRAGERAQVGIRRTTPNYQDG